MEIILITGLDGSGKSTVLAELSKIKDSNAFELIYLPTIDAESLQEDLMLKKTSEFVNYINQLADEKQITSLKAIAIFSAMLLFKKIYEFKSRPMVNTIFCERHPLIDTLVYAHFYAEKTGTVLFDKELMAQIDITHKDELEYLIRCIPKSCALNPRPSILWFAEFIYKRFYVEKKIQMEDLNELFEVNLPNKIYYLRANAGILYSRISDREIHEAHESVEILRKLGKGYDQLFNELDKSNSGLVEIVDANQLPELDKFKARLLKKYSHAAL